MMTAATVAAHDAPLSRKLARSRSVFGATAADQTGSNPREHEFLVDSQLKRWLIELDNLRGATIATRSRRLKVLKALGELLFSRMGMHRALFSPQWDSQGPEHLHYDSKFRPIDLSRDVLYSCSVEADELVAVVERKTSRADAFVLTRTVRFPLCYLADDGESSMWSEAAQRLQRRRAERDAANARFDDSESEVQSLLACYCAVAR